MPILQTIFRLLFFKISRAEMLAFNYSHLSAGLLGTWLVGMGRYWDDPGAKLLQHLGLGSVIYIFVLALLIWIIIKPLKVADWTYFSVLTFISLTSFPAIFYAIPVERFFSLAVANEINVWFLAVVATWRLALLFFFLRRFTDLSVGQVLTTTLLPICAIIASLAQLNLHRVVFNIMGGVRNESPHDSAYGILILLTVVSTILVVPLLISYLFSIFNRREKRKANEDLEQIK